MKTTNKILLGAFLFILVGIATILIILRVHLSQMDTNVPIEIHGKQSSKETDMSHIEIHGKQSSKEIDLSYN